MAAHIRLDQDGAIQALQAETSLSAEDATGIVHIISRFLVLPAFEKSASKAGEASARGKLRAELSKAFGQIDEIRTIVGDLVERVTTLEVDLKAIKDRLTKVETDIADLKEAFKELKSLVLWGFGGSTTIIGIFIAVLAAVK